MPTTTDDLPPQQLAAESGGGHEADPLVERMQKAVDASGNKWSSHFRRIGLNRQLMQGEVPDTVEISTDGSGRAARVRANMILSTAQTLLPHLYAKNPEYTIRPRRQAGTSGLIYQIARQFSETADIVLNAQMEAGGLKREGKRWVRSIQAARVGWLKLSYQKDYYRDPIIQRRINDSQDNLSRVKAQINEARKEGSSAEEQEAERQRLVDMITSLEEQVEVLRAEGLVVEFISVNDMRMDPGIDYLEDYLRADWLAQGIWMNARHVKEWFEVPDDEMSRLRLFRRSDEGRRSDQGTTSVTSDESLDRYDARVWEFWSKGTNSVYTFASGGKTHLRPPMHPRRLGQRWYPYFMAGFHWIDGFEWPTSDVEQLENLQDEYEETSRQRNEHRRANAPHWVARAADLDREDVIKIKTAGMREIVLIDVDLPIEQVIRPWPGVALNPGMYDQTPTRADIQWVSGADDAARGGVMRAKTLGEAEIVRSGLASRTDGYRDELEEMFEEIGRYGLEIILQEMSLEAVRRIAGPGAYWPSLAKDEIYNLVEIEVVAGSTGKPDHLRDQQQWSQILQPLTGLIDKIMALRAQGIPDPMNPYVSLLEHLLKVFDQRLDIESILPPVQQQPAQPAMQPGGAAEPGTAAVLPFPVPGGTT
jgi:hypothetical protein